MSLKAPDSYNAALSERVRNEVNMLSQAYPNIGEAYRLRELLKQDMDDAIKNNRIAPLNNLIKKAIASRVEPIIAFVNMLHQH